MTIDYQTNPIRGVESPSDNRVVVLFVATDDEDDEGPHVNDVVCSKELIASLVDQVAALKREQTKIWEQIKKLRRYPYAVSPFVTTTELDVALSLRKGTAKQLVIQGRLEGHTVGSHLFVLEEDVLNYVRDCPAKAA